MPLTIRNRREELVLLEINDLQLIEYLGPRSPFLHVFEVLTRDGKNCVAQGNDRRQVVRDAIKYLEAKAVLTGRPVRGLQASTYTFAAVKAHLRDLQIKEHLRVFDFQKFSTDDPDLPTSL